MSSIRLPRIAHLAAAATVLAMLALLAHGATEAGAQCPPNSCAPYTFMLSASSGGGMPNGPSRNAAISQDDRIASVVAFESDASNIVGGDTNGLTDVIYATRKKPYGTNGTRWVTGSRKRASIGIGGKPANGRSYKPAVSGNLNAAPRCVAFVSDATNLVPGDTNRRADAFVYDVAKGTTRRVSVSSTGAQSNGTTFDVAVDGRCQRFTFTSNASNLDLNSTTRPQWRSAVTKAPPAGTRQVFSRFVEEPGYSKSGLKGLTFLASATNGTPGNRDSYEVTMSSRQGDAVAFTSSATNLSSADRSAITDVYSRQMPLVNGSGGKTPRLTTNLISRSRTGTGGNGASSAPTISGNQFDSPSGSFIAFQTSSTNVGTGFADSNGKSDIVRANLKGGKVTTRYLSNGQSCSSLGNGPSQRPTISEAGSTVMYHSDASNFTCDAQVNRDRNGAIADVFTWTEKRLGSILFSFDTNKKELGFPSRNPATSARINYYLWETRDPFADIALAQRSGYYNDPAAIRARAAQEPRFSQVYMRYGGPE